MVGDAFRVGIVLRIVPREPLPLLIGDEDCVETGGVPDPVRLVDVGEDERGEEGVTLFERGGKTWQVSQEVELRTASRTYRVTR
jgi:hypothetical protein